MFRKLHLILLFWACLPFCSAESAFLLIPGSKQPVEVDGVLHEEAWRHATGSILIPAKYPEVQQVESGYFRVLYNSDGLYFSGELDQSFLDPVANQLDKTKNKGGMNDSKIYSDDCVEIFLQSPGSERYHHLAWNSDAKMIYTIDRAYGDNDRIGDHPIRLATRKSERSWFFEVCIPWNSLDVKVLDGQRLLMKVYRSNAPKQELSGWTTLSTNFHDPQHWGTISLSENSTGIRGLRFTAGEGCATYAVSLSPGTYEFEGVLNEKPFVVKSGTRTRTLQGKIDMDTGTSSVSITSNGNLLWRSPLLQEQTTMKKAMIEIDDGDYQIFVNGELFQQGNGALKKEFPLPGALNVIGIAFTGKEFSTRMTLNQLVVKPTQWLFTNTPEDNWLSKDFIPEDWKQYPGGEVAEKHFFRLTVVCGHLLFAPQNPDFTIHAVNKTTHELRLRTMSPVPYSLTDYEVVFISPQELSVPLYDFDNRLYNRYKHHFSNTVSGGMRTLSFKFVDPMPVREYNFGFHVVNFMTKFDFPETGEYPVIIYQKGRGLQEFPQQYILRIMPELKPGKCRRIITKISEEGMIGKCFTTAEYKTAWDTLVKSGINNISFEMFEGYSDFVQHMRKNDISATWVQFMHHDSILKDILSARPDCMHVNPVYPPPAWKQKSQMCPLAYMSIPEIDTLHKECMPHFDFIMFDTENGLKGACLCDQCRTAFAKQFKLNEVPDAKTIYNNYEQELLQFQIQMLRKIISFQTNLAKKYHPGIKTMIYSGYAYPANKVAYGVDWSLYRDIDYPAAGYGLSSKIIADTRKELGGLPMICGFFPSTDLWQRPWRDQDMKGRLFQLLRDGGFLGTFVFARQEMDGRGLTAFADFTRGCAAFEDMLNEKYQIPAPDLVNGLPEGDVTIYQKDHQYLVLAINLGSSPRDLQIKVPQSLRNAEAFNFYQNTRTRVDNTFSVNVPANDAALVFLEEKAK